MNVNERMIILGDIERIGNYVFLLKSACAHTLNTYTLQHCVELRARTLSKN